MKFQVYIYEGSTENKEFSRGLALDAIMSFASLNDITFDREKAVIKTEEKGKPYIEGAPIFFNISHSGILWVCMVGENECGIDIQVSENMDVKKYEKIIARYFTENEKKFCDKFGTDGFFRVWSHREAYGKLTGEGFYGKMPDFVGDDGFLNIDVVCPEDSPFYGKTAYVKDEPVGEGIYLAYATFGEDDEIEILG